MSRRHLLQTGGVAGALSLTGCSGLFGSGETDRDAETPTREPVETVGTVPTGDDRPAVTADEARVEETLSSLSLSEKIGQMTLLEPRSRGSTFELDRARNAVGEYGVGGVLFGGANAPGTSAEDAASYFNGVQQAAMDRVGVPLLTGIDAIHGNATIREAAVYPHQIGLGATWNADLAARVAARTARSLGAMGVNWTYSPVADVSRDPRWGRYYECFSEDPHVAGAFTRAMVRGYERPADGTKRVAASVKHFAGYSFPETGDDRDPADLSVRTLRDVVLPPFEAGVDAGAETVMANSGSVNGVPAHASEWLQTTVLRERWGFDGLVVSDWRDVHRLLSMHEYTSSLAEAVEAVVNAGVDVYMAPHVEDIEQYQPTLKRLVEDGRVGEERVDEAVRRVLRVKDRLGLFDDPTVPVERRARTLRPADRDLALRAAEQSLTLLQNESALPVGPGASVLVTGPNADSVPRQLGGWTTAWQGAGSADAAPETTTVREGVASVAPDGADVTHVETGADSLSNRSELADAAADADVAVAVVGEGAYAEGSGDVDDLRLPDGQRELVATLGEADVTTAGVLVAGRPRGSPDLFDRLDAALMAYYPGSEGGTAVARALFGETAPAGRLPFTWPRSVGQVPSVVGHRPPAGDDAPLFEFGHRASYAPVFYEDVALSAASLDGASDADGFAAAVTVRNDGDRATDECVVVTASFENAADVSESPVVAPARRVVGFARTRVESESSTTVTVPVSLDALAVTAGGVTGGGERVVPRGKYVFRAESARAELTVESTEPI